MKLWQWLTDIRTIPPRLPANKAAGHAVLVLLAGLVAGVVAKASDSVSFLGDLGTGMGVWVFTATLLAADAHRPDGAALHVPVFFLGMLAGYYAYGQWVLGFFPQAYALGWLLLALGTPLPAFALWFARGRGPVAAALAALPTGLLFAIGAHAFYTADPVAITTLLLGATLVALLPRSWQGCLVTFLLALLLAFGFHGLRRWGLPLA